MKRRQRGQTPAEQFDMACWLRRRFAARAIAAARGAGPNVIALAPYQFRLHAVEWLELACITEGPFENATGLADEYVAAGLAESAHGDRGWRLSRAGRAVMRRWESERWLTALRDRREALRAGRGTS